MFRNLKLEAVLKQERGLPARRRRVLHRRFLSNCFQAQVAGALRAESQQLSDPHALEAGWERALTSLGNVVAGNSQGENAEAFGNGP